MIYHKRNFLRCCQLGGFRKDENENGVFTIFLILDAMEIIYNKLRKKEDCQVKKVYSEEREGIRIRKQLHKF